MLYLEPNDCRARALVAAIQGGDVSALKRMLIEDPQLADVRLGAPTSHCATAGSRTLLHVATDWPGHFPNGAETVAVLLDAGTDVNSRCIGSHEETPLHW